MSEKFGKKITARKPIHESIEIYRRCIRNTYTNQLRPVSGYRLHSGGHHLRSLQSQGSLLQSMSPGLRGKESRSDMLGLRMRRILCAGTKHPELRALQGD